MTRSELNRYARLLAALPMLLAVTCAGAGGPGQTAPDLPQPDLAIPGFSGTGLTPLRSVTDLLDALGKSEVPFHIEVRFRFGCAAGLCKWIQIPSSAPAQDPLGDCKKWFAQCTPEKSGAPLTADCERWARRCR